MGEVSPLGQSEEKRCEHQTLGLIRLNRGRKRRARGSRAATQWKPEDWLSGFSAKR